MKKTLIISVALIGFVLAVTGNSWAQRESTGYRHSDRGGHFQKWDKPGVHKFDRNHGRVYRPGNQHFSPHLQKRQQIHKLRRYRRPVLPRWHYRPHHRPAVIHRHYGSTPSALQAFAALSESGFAVSVGVSQTY